MVTPVTALKAGIRRAVNYPVPGGPPTGRTSGPAAAADLSGPRKTMRSWPLLILAAPAATEVWFGWAGIAQKTAFGLVSPLPDIWPSLHLDTTITLPADVEAYAAYALRAWLATGPTVIPRHEPSHAPAVFKTRP
jgi:hypothetical protein